MRDLSKVDFWIWVLLALSIVPGLIGAAWISHKTRNAKAAEETEDEERRSWQAHSI